MTIKHDISDRSVVTTCTRCPFWASFSFDLDEAERREVNHNLQVHEMKAKAASAAVKKRHQRARHAATR